MTTSNDPTGQILSEKYRIDGFLTQGGMGAVYRGTHLMLGRTVAIKLIKPELVTSQAIVDRFLREARAASQLSHPNIVAVHDLGQTDDRTLYIAMELVDGRSLKELIKSEGPLSPERVVRLAKDICSALSLAHKNGVIHRDLKPQNVMICTGTDGLEMAKLLDFGIAKTFEPDEPALTATGMVLGTPQYMSPEQAQGQTVDARTDLYALGIILYEMIGGHVPFRDTSIPALLVKHMQEVPPPLSAIRAELPPGLVSTVQRCLEKNPAARFATADELARALGDSLTNGARAAALVSPPPPPMAAAARPGSAAETRESTRPTAPAGPHGTPPAPTGGRWGLLVAMLAIAAVIFGGTILLAWRMLRSDDTPDADGVAQMSVDEPETVPASALGASAETVRRAEAESGASTLASTATPKPGAETTPAPAQRAAANTQVPPRATPQGTPKPTPQPLPTTPSVAMKCNGIADACSAVLHALQQSLKGAGLPVVSRSGSAEIVVEVQAEEIEARSEEQFGTTFVIKTYSLASVAEAVRFGDMVPMPPPESFNFDSRLGAEKVNERSRVFASAITDAIGEYWSGVR
jgi:serine/threonine-protein kinase